MKVRLARDLLEPQAFGVSRRGRRVVALWSDAQTVAMHRAAEVRRVEAALQELAGRKATLEATRRRLEEVAHRLSGSGGIEETRERPEAMVARLDEFVRAVLAPGDGGGAAIPGLGAPSAEMPSIPPLAKEGSASTAETGPAGPSGWQTRVRGAFLAGRFYLDRAAGRPTDVAGVVGPAVAALPLNEETRDFFCDAALACLEAGHPEPARAIAQRFRRAGWSDFRGLVARGEPG